LYDKDFLVNPTVSVSVLKYSDRSVNVTGAVNDAKRVQFPPERGLTVVDAITLAGGHNRYADLKKVKLTRKTSDGESETRDVDVDAIQKKGARDVTLEPGDVIFVPERVI
jgi:polysaccharide export outer membrane protein